MKTLAFIRNIIRMNVRFYLDPSRGNDTAYIMLSFTYSSRQIRVATGEHIAIVLWDQTDQRVKRSATGARQINAWLSQCSDKILEIYRDARASTPVPDPNVIQQQFCDWLNPPPPVEEASLVDYFERYIKDVTPHRSKFTLQHYRSTLKKLRKFSEETNIPLVFSSMTVSFYDKLLEYLFAEGLINESASKIIKNVKAFLSYAAERDWCEPINTKKWRLLEDEIYDSIALTAEELQIWQTLDLSDSFLSRSRDEFLLNCFTGLRYGDAHRIWQNNGIKKGVMTVWTDKTREPAHIPISDIVLIILRRYPEGLKTVSNQVFNRDLKEIAKIAKMDTAQIVTRYRGANKVVVQRPRWKLVSTHTARRTFVTQSLLRGMPTAAIRQITGHKDERSFQKYIRLIQKDIEEQYRKAWS